MNAAQKAALRHVCLLAEETMHPALSHYVPGGTLVLSINAGYE